MDSSKKAALAAALSQIEKNFGKGILAPYSSKPTFSNNLHLTMPAPVKKQTIRTRSSIPTDWWCDNNLSPRTKLQRLMDGYFREELGHSPITGVLVITSESWRSGYNNFWDHFRTTCGVKPEAELDEAEQLAASQVLEDIQDSNPFQILHPDEIYREYGVSGFRGLPNIEHDIEKILNGLPPEDFQEDINFIYNYSTPLRLDEDKYLSRSLAIHLQRKLALFRRGSRQPWYSGRALFLLRLDSIINHPDDWVFDDIMRSLFLMFEAAKLGDGKRKQQLDAVPVPKGIMITFLSKTEQKSLDLRLQERGIPNFFIKEPLNKSSLSG